MSGQPPRGRQLTRGGVAEWRAVRLVLSLLPGGAGVDDDGGGGDGGAGRGGKSAGEAE